MYFINASCTVCGIKVIFESDLIQDFLCVPQLGSQVQQKLYFYGNILISKTFRIPRLHQELLHCQKLTKNPKQMSPYGCQGGKHSKYL